VKNAVMNGYQELKSQRRVQIARREDGIRRGKAIQKKETRQIKLF